MLRKIWKFLWISTVSFIGFVTLVIILVAIFVPESERQPVREENIEAEEPKPEPPPIQYKTVDWTLTPEEQGLKVGDWIEAWGHPNLLQSSHRSFRRKLDEMDDIDISSGEYYLETDNNNFWVNYLRPSELGSAGVEHTYRPFGSKRSDYFDADIKIRCIETRNIQNPRENSSLMLFDLLRLHSFDNITSVILRGKISSIGRLMQYRKTETPQQIIMLESENYDFQLTATLEEITGAMTVAKANAMAVMNEFKQFESHR